MNRAPFRAAAAVAAALAIAQAGHAAAEDACIPPKVMDALAACTVGSTAGPTPKHTPAPVPPMAHAPSKSAPSGPPAPDAKLGAAEVRRGLASVRSIQLLLTEIQGLETLVSATSAGASDRPGLLRRLADGYVELETASFRKKVEARVAADEAKRKDPGRVAGFTTEAARAEKIEGAARQAAIKWYGELRAKHAGWCQSGSTQGAPATGCIDETLYDLAYEHEQAGNAGEARKVYLELIQTAPTSKYVPTAYLAFGELFFGEAQADPSKWALAEQSYKEVLRYPAPANKVLGYASYKLAYVYWNKGDFAQALSALKRTIDVGTQFPALPNGKPLAAAARHDLVPLFALTGDPRKAYDFLHPLSGDASGDTERTFALMGDLGQGYLDVGHFKEGIELYQDLLKRDRGPKSCAYQGHVTEAVLALKTGDKAAAKAELDRQLQLEQRFAREAQPDDAKLACKNLTASLAVETAMIWHLEAVGSGNVRGTMAEGTMTLAADLYDKVLAQFTAAEFGRFEFPRLVKEDWPSRLKVAMSRAELLYAQKDWPRCGPAYDAVVDEEPRGPLATEAAYVSALCHQHAFLAAHHGQARPVVAAAASGNDAASIAPRELSAEQKSMLRSFDRFLCVAKPDPSDKQAYDTYVEVELARARTYFEAHRWPEAAAALRPLAVSRPVPGTAAALEATSFAAQIYLEALNVMGSHGTPACLDTMASDLPAIVDRECGGDRKSTNAEACSSVTRVSRDVEWRVCEVGARRLEGAGAGSGTGGERGWEEVAGCYMRLWTAHGKEACEAKQPGCDRMDEVLTNAARAFGAARLLAKAIAVRKLLLDPRYGMEGKPLARTAARDVGRNYQAIAVYDEAASFYERFAHDSPSHADAAASLEDAIVLRLGLGQEDRALDDAELFRRAYQAQHPALAAQIAFAIGAHRAEREDFAEARKRLSAAMGDIDRSATLDVQIQAHAVLARSLSRTGSEAAAATEYAKVRSLYADPAAVASKLRAAVGGDDEALGRRLAKALTAVGEAVYYAAAQRQRGVDAIRFPEYHGSGRRDDVLAHVHTKVAAWVNKKRPAIEEAEKEYRQILALTPSAPPRWVIAAGARVGQMWGKFVAEFRAAPIPSEWKQNGPSPYGDLRWEEIRAAYYEAIDIASEPFRLRAKVAYEGCLGASTRYQYFDQHSRACEAWLSRNYGRDYHILDELHGAPTRLGMRVDAPPALLAP
jgi:hypothetical protein